MTVMSEVPKQDVIKRIDKALRPRQLALKPAPADQPPVEDDRNGCYRWNLVDARSNQQDPAEPPARQLRRGHRCAPLLGIRARRADPRPRLLSATSPPGSSIGEKSTCERRSRVAVVGPHSRSTFPEGHGATRATRHPAARNRD